MDVTTVEMDKLDAKEIYQQYQEALKTKVTDAQKQYEDLKKTYHAMSKGFKVIDIYKAFVDTGVDEDGNPKLAIAQAHLSTIRFNKERGGGGYFTEDRGWATKERVIDVRLPGETFPDWPLNNPDQNWSIKDREISTNVPLVPVQLLPPGKLENYYTLFEVKEWKTRAVVEDPYLLKRINANTFAVLAEWDVTEVEAIVMRGRV